MTSVQQSLPAAPIAANGADISAATDRLFQEIASTSDNPAVARDMLLLNAGLGMIRPYEDLLIPDRETELRNLSDCWARRDLGALQVLISAYFKRRQALVPQIIDMIQRPH